MPILSGVAAIDPAMQRAKSMLLPFRFGKWLKMGFIGWLAGELASFSFGLQSPNFPNVPAHAAHGGSPNPADFHFEHLIPVIIAVVVVVFLIGLLFTFLFSRFRFVLFDVVINKEIVIGRGWRTYASQGYSYFAFWLLFGLFSFACLGAIIGLPVLHAYQQGVFQNGPDNIGAILAFLGTVFLGLFLFGLLMYVLGTVAKDFLVPLMALDNLSVGQAWSVLLKMLRAQKGAFAGYLGMKFVLYIVAGLLMGIAIVIVVLILAIPIGVIAAVALGGARAAGSAFGLGIGIMLLVLVVGSLLTLLMLICIAPFSTFFSSYALYFFGGRYPKLGALLWPEPPPAAPVGPLPTPPPPIPAAPAT